MKVVVIGATGNVGSAVVRALSADAQVDEVVGLARRLPELQLPKVTWGEADITRDDLAPRLRGADAVVHLAWLIQPSRNEAITHQVNVEGSARVFAAAAAAGVGTVVYASSVGAYSPGPKDRAVDESWPTTGIESSFYARHKAAVERILDSFEAEHPETRVVRLRPGLIFQREAATEIRRLFAGPLVPNPLLRRALIPIVPRIDRLRFQAVHSHDVGEAYRLAVVNDAARGAYNVAAEPVLDPDVLADLLGARPVTVPPGLLRALAAVTWRARLQPTPPGWLDMALSVPIMDTTRAREHLGWEPRHSSGDALLALLDGMREGAGFQTPPLAAETSGPLRVREVLTGVGHRNP
jgi:nucleoside-diphosphate-sugar epimerase